MGSGGRHKARVVALQALYEADTSPHAALEALARIAAHEGTGEEQTAFARHLIETAQGQQDELDGLIGRHAPAWPVEQLSPIDRNILRLAISEMLGDNGTPVKVVINEAIELAKRFGSERSSKFINGVLGAVYRERIEARESTAGRG
jgi:N utilization substance protein B